MAVTSSCYPTIYEITKASQTPAKDWNTILPFTTRSDSIRHWATGHQRRYIVAEEESLNWLRGKRSNQAPNLTYSPRKMVWTMGYTLDTRL